VAVVFMPARIRMPDVPVVLIAPPLGPSTSTECASISTPWLPGNCCRLQRRITSLPAAPTGRVVSLTASTCPPPSLQSVTTTVDAIAGSATAAAAIVPRTHRA
jgi:hypothetical protein